MNVTRKDATITNTDEDFPGSFQVVLSTPSKDRDGDELAPEDWKQPLPEHITFDTDHGMSVEKTVGSGTPRLEADGRLIVSGTYSSLPKAQETRTLVKEGHIRTVSVAFMSEKVTKDGRTRTRRELLNGAFVAVPSNRDALVLSSKSGARNSKTDQAHMQTAHDHLVAAGAQCAPEDDSGAAAGATGGKALSYAEAREQFGIVTKAKYSAEQQRQMLTAGHALKGPDGEPSYPIGDKEDLVNAIHAVGRGGADHDKIRSYIIGRAKDLGASNLIPANWSGDGSMKAYSGDPDSDPGALAQAVDAALDQVDALLQGIDVTTLPEPVQQALGLITAAEEAVDELLDALGVTDPDEPTEEPAPAAAGKAAPAAETEATLDLQNRLTVITATASLAG